MQAMDALRHRWLESSTSRRKGRRRREGAVKARESLKATSWSSSAPLQSQPQRRTGGRGQVQQQHTVTKIVFPTAGVAVRLFGVVGVVGALCHYRRRADQEEEEPGTVASYLS